MSCFSLRRGGKAILGRNCSGSIAFNRVSGNSGAALGTDWSQINVKFEGLKIEDQLSCIVNVWVINYLLVDSAVP